MEALRKLARSPITAAVILVLAGVALFFSMRSAGAPAATIPQYYYTDDEGKTYFKDSAERIVPFDRNGKQAVRAHVFKAANGATFVAWMERYTEKAAAIMRKVRPEDGKPPVALTAADMAELARGNEYRKTGDPKWTPGGGNGPGGAMLAGKMLKEIKGPDGSTCVELSEEFPR